MTMPTSIISGNTLAFNRSLSGYSPDDGWSLSYALVKDGKQIAFNASDAGDGTFDIEEDTTDWVAGQYSYQETVTDGSQTKTILVGLIEVTPDFAKLPQGYDARSFIKQTLDALEAQILAGAGKDVSSYSINGRSLSRMSPTELLEKYDYFKREYQRELKEERLANGMGSGNKILTRFTQ